MIRITLATVVVAVVAASPQRTSGQESDNPLRFRTIVLTEEFHSEGAAAADIDDDGVLDVVSGPYWYAGPSYQSRHRYMPGEPHSIAGYSDHFFTWCEDFNGDGHADIVTVGMPGQPAFWFANPGKVEASHEKLWKRHLLMPDVGGESPSLVDFDGDGDRDLVCIHGRRFGYATANDNPTAKWTFHPISKDDGLGVFTHGMGVGDVDGDDRNDLLETRGWWRNGEGADSFELQPFRFAQSGGAQMFAHDFDHDGDQDVLSVLNAHGWGLNWYERRGKDEDFLFVPHAILSSPKGSAIQPALPDVALSQMHAVAVADMDGDGYQDIVTGKRFWAHGGNDPGAQRLPLLYALRTYVDSGQLKFAAHLIHTRVGVGTQLTVEDLNDDLRPDIVVANKLGTFVLINDPQAAEPPTLTKPLAAIGTDAFRNHVRETEPQTPSQQRQSFVLPLGFDIELVASEPQINKPLNMNFDSNGRLWVTSTVEYPVPATGRKGRDSIKLLEDTNGDGNYNRTTTFANGLNIPMGLYPYRDGVVCFDIPDIVFLRDTDGDGRADKRQKLCGPFDTTRDTHGMCNAFTRGYDGWLYACHGFNNQSVVSGSDGHTVEMSSGNVFRFRLDGSRIEHFGRGQVNPFGLTIDRWGDVYTADCHTKPINLVLPGGYHDSFGKPHDGLGYVPNVLDHLHGSTGVGGIALGESLSFPASYQHSTFGGNVVTGRVNRNTLHRAGAVRAVEEPDFVVSGDPWFRPVDLQAGPDGALYIADFYNRIIGHYEVKLDHPGRDRRRGRIWRVTYRGEAATLPPIRGFPTDLSDLSTGQLFDRLQGANPKQRRRITNWLCDARMEEAVAESKDRLARPGTLDEPTWIVCLWIAARAASLTDDQAAAALASSEPAVRAHAFHALAFTKQIDIETLEVGLNDQHPTVQRAAAMSAVEKLIPGSVEPLLQCLDTSAPDAAHLRHALRIALKTQLRDAAAFSAAAERLGPKYAPHLEAICLALEGTEPGNFIARRLSRTPPKSTERLKELASYAAHHAAPEVAAEMTEVLQQSLGGDLGAQLQLLEALHRPTEQLPEVRQWALTLATHLAELSGTRQERLPWRFAPLRSNAQGIDKQNCWVVSTRRRCADGVQEARLFSSFPRGEQRVGIYRSGTFMLTDEFSFFIAGHDGFPDKPSQRNNWVRLRLATTHEVIRQATPPRNDVAQKVLWDTSRWGGQEAYLELVDGDRARAYAWLAVGRFSDTRLNPQEGRQHPRQAAQLVQRYQLNELQPTMAQLLKRNPYDLQVAAALAELADSTALRAAQQALSFAALPSKLRASLVQALVEGEEKGLTDALAKSLRVATGDEQRRAALALTRDRQGLELLLSLVEHGAVAPRVLADARVTASLEAVGTNQQRAKVAKWLAELPADRPELIRKIEQIRQQYLNQGGNMVAGRALFQKNCAVCHQVAGQGKKVGPNLDGIGNRGLSRLTEDVLTPSRNVDVAFRTTTLVTEDGEVITGAMLPDDGSDSVTVVNAKGEPLRVAKSEIARQKKSPTSPMPDNFSESVSDKDLRDLFAYLLSLR